MNIAKIAKMDIVAAQAAQLAQSKRFIAHRKGTKLLGDVAYERLCQNLQALDARVAQLKRELS